MVAASFGFGKRIGKSGFLPLALSGALLLGYLDGASAQTWPDKDTATPDLVQTDFGPNGSSLPLDGGSYCGPTSAAMALGYLYNAGFTQLFNNAPDDASYLNLVRVLSGLAGTSDSGGTYSEGVLSAVDTYFSAKGISPANHFITNPNDGNHRTLSEIAAENVDQNILIGVIGWYNEEGGVYYRNGGHFVTITGQDVANGTLTIHNPYPNALLDQPNLPAYVLQTLDMVNFVATTSNTNPSLGNATYLQFNTDEVGPSLYTQGILEQVFNIRVESSQLPSEGFVPQDWVINSEKFLNTGGGELTVETKVTGSGSIRKNDEGSVIFRKEVTLTGDHTIQAGTVASEVTSGEALGTGSIALSGTGKLAFKPSDASPSAISLAVASRANDESTPGSTVSFSGANEILLNKGANTSLEVTIGGNSGNGVANLAQSGTAPTLVISANDLGGSEKLKVTGTGANLPTLVNGMTSANIVGSSGAQKNGYFLSYDQNDGFVHAVTTSGDINSATATTIYESTSTQELTGDVSVYALAVNNTTVSGDQTLSVGAGVILNGGTISTETLDFGANAATIYTSKDGGTIDSSLTGSGGLVKFGAGELVLNSTSSQFSGDSYVNEGTLVLSAPGAWSSSADTLNVRSGAKLVVDNSASFVGTIVAASSSNIVLNGGSVGDVELQSSTAQVGPAQGSTLQGTGTITGDLTYNGYIAGVDGAGVLTIDGLVTTDSGAGFIWSLHTLVDDSDGSAGLDWNSIVFTNSEAMFGSEDDGVSFLFDFGAGLDPNSGNAFWSEDHIWTLFTFDGRESAAHRAFMDFPTSSFPAGNFGYYHVDNTIVVAYTAVPEPSTVGLTLLALASLGFRCRLNRA